MKTKILSGSRARWSKIERDMFKSAFTRSVLVLALFSVPAHAASSSSDWCLSRLLDKGPLLDAGSEFESMSDIVQASTIEAFARTIRPELKIKPGDFPTPEQRYELLRPVPIDRITAAPGHAFLRNPKQLAGLKNYITSSGGGDFAHDPLLLNLITNSEGEILTIDLWNAHHRLVAYLEAGYHFIGDIPSKNIKILIDGKTAEGQTWSHFLSIAGIDETKRIPYGIVPPGGDIRVGTISVDGKLPNFHLGSRNSIGQLRLNMLRRKSPKIGVYFGTFDPPHRGHLTVVEKSIRELGLDEAVIVASPNPAHKPGANDLLARVEMLRRFARGKKKINVYVGDSGPIINTFGRDPFFERIAQTYGTHDLYQIIGQDSYENLLRENRIPTNSNRKYVVLTRPDPLAANSSGPQVPPELKNIVHVIANPESRGLSSTAVRRLISEGKPVSSEIVDPAVLEYIRERGLYRPPGT